MLLGNTIKLAHMPFGLVPKVLNSVDVVCLVCKQFRVINTEVLEVRYIQYITEIETFQRASVIIPNADLISSPVINWTHKNVQGRVDIMVGVSYDTVPSEVEKILLECAKNHSNVQGWPEPSVLFSDFGPSSLDFELRAYLTNVEDRLTTGSELRFAIFEAFKANNIEIPFPHRVIHMAASDVT